MSERRSNQIGSVVKRVQTRREDRDRDRMVTAAWSARTGERSVRGTREIEGRQGWTFAVEIADGRLLLGRSARLLEGRVVEFGRSSLKRRRRRRSRAEERSCKYAQEISKLAADDGNGGRLPIPEHQQQLRVGS
ncbi:hypothetical protein AXG93_3559s1090 [Marchantia polymorpha subsp. ruderalis]|uniref:Uncharacterized protein n=1 Tax=Marchantia polymorpha subsp. ruderalis TaxID=1480154 RepID=A0A176WMN0_MARPO|nr:hypothetical protein AXG93_3559s1090 [Marchantia polymorpha subsp. ruderalis]